VIHEINSKVRQARNCTIKNRAEARFNTSEKKRKDQNDEKDKKKDKGKPEEPPKEPEKKKGK
jgi:hypothetical protein